MRRMQKGTRRTRRTPRTPRQRVRLKWITYCCPGLQRVVHLALLAFQVNRITANPNKVSPVVPGNLCSRVAREKKLRNCLGSRYFYGRLINTLAVMGYRWNYESNTSRNLKKKSLKKIINNISDTELKLLTFEFVFRLLICYEV